MISAVALKQPEIASLCKEFGVHRLEIFGSAATEDQFDPARSDVDFIVDFQNYQPMGPWLQRYFFLRQALSELLGLPVDLVMASAMKNKYFIREANRTRRLIYGPEEFQFD